MAERNASRRDAKKNRARGRPNIESVEPLNLEQERIQEWLREVRFKKNLLGSLNEADVWKKIGELNSLYEAALSAERERYNILLTERMAVVKQRYLELLARRRSKGDESNQ